MWRRNPGATNQCYTLPLGEQENTTAKSRDGSLRLGNDPRTIGYGEYCGGLEDLEDLGQIRKIQDLQDLLQSHMIQNISEGMNDYSMDWISLSYP